MTFDSVTLDGLDAAHTKIENSDLHEQKAAPLDCSGRFARFPEIPTAPEAKVTIPPDDPTLYVAASGSGDFWSIQHASDIAPAEGAVISVAPGTYREVLTVTKPNITIRSAYDDASKTVIVFDKSAGTSGGTFNSATVNVKAPNFTAENITFANDWNRTHEQVPVGSQALALSVTGDRAVFRNVRLLGNQDTLYAAGGKRLLVPINYAPNQSQCYIELPFTDLAGSTWRLRDQMAELVYQREGSELQSRGLYLDVPAWNISAFSITKNPK